MRLLVQPDVEQRFWDKVQKLECGCWLWKGVKTKYGIGRFKYRGKLRSAHRFAYEVFYEAIPDDVWIVRRPECKTPGCCNPEHLMLGDRSIAMGNGCQRGTVNPPDNASIINTQEHKISRKFTPEQVKEIRLLLSQDVSVIYLTWRYQVDAHTIYRVKNNEHYKDV
ncbi:MAG: hypothetical protein V7K21_19160 [Nostoc sp.]|uniref:hypothetical protein n=1 Tax=Nostoc sp. TaxID=1180 RepID=UPI002FFC0982